MEDTVRTNQVPNTPLRGADPDPLRPCSICLRTWCGRLATGVPFWLPRGRTASPFRPLQCRAGRGLLEPMCHSQMAAPAASRRCGRRHSIARAMALLAYHPAQLQRRVVAKPNEFGLDLAGCALLGIHRLTLLPLSSSSRACLRPAVAMDEGLAHLNRKRIRMLPQRRVVGWLFVQCRAAVGSPDVSERTKKAGLSMPGSPRRSGCRVIASLRLWIVVKPPRLYVVPGFSEGLALTLHWRLVGDTSFLARDPDY